MKGVHGTYVKYHEKQTYQNNMEPKGTSQQESRGVRSFLEMENIGNPEFPENEYKQILTKRGYLRNPSESQDRVRIVQRF